MRTRAIAPFSKYRVGAAIETQSGKIIGGCNIESSSFSLTCCAERVTLFRALAEGYTVFKSMAVSTNNGGMPCGACRQVIWDLCGDIGCLSGFFGVISTQSYYIVLIFITLNQF